MYREFQTSAEQLAKGGECPFAVFVAVLERPDVAGYSHITGFHADRVNMEIFSFDDEFAELGIKADGAFIETVHIRHAGEIHCGAVFQDEVVVQVGRNSGAIGFHKKSFLLYRWSSVYENQTGRDVDLRRNKSHTPVSVRVVYAEGGGDRTEMVLFEQKKKSVYNKSKEELHGQSNS